VPLAQQSALMTQAVDSLGIFVTFLSPWQFCYSFAGKTVGIIVQALRLARNTNRRIVRIGRL
jgi:hypothetical protein